MGKMGGAHIFPRISSRKGAPSAANHSLGASSSRGWKGSAALAALAPVMRAEAIRPDLPWNAETQLLPWLSPVKAVAEEGQAAQPVA